MKLFLVRHGVSLPRREWSGEPELRPLGQMGTRQADALAELFEREPIDRLVCSPALRCQQTLERVVRVTGRSLEVDERLHASEHVQRVLELMPGFDEGAVVFCTHREVIHSLLRVFELVPLDQRLELLSSRPDARVVGEMTHHHVGGEDVAGRGVLPSGRIDRNAHLLGREHPRMRRVDLVVVGKRRVVEHYGAVGPVMLPHVADRPLTLQRFPNGVMQKGFMQKNASNHFPDFIGRFEIATPNTTTVYPVVTTVDGLERLVRNRRIGQTRGRLALALPELDSGETGSWQRRLNDARTWRHIG